MKTKIKELSGSRRLFEIEIPIEAIAEELESVYKGIEKAAEVPGYRIGKAPRNLIEARYKDKAEGEAKRRLISDYFLRAVKDSGLNAIGTPAISDVTFEVGKPLVFKAEVNVRPEVRLKSYKGLKVTKQPVNVTTEDVDKVLEELRERNAHLKDVEGRPAKDEDWCFCDVEVVVEAKAVEKNEGVWFPLNAKATKKEFRDQLIGSVPGDTKTVKTLLPKDYPRKEAAGKEAAFLITVKGVKEKLLPVIDDEFAKDAGGFKSLLELRGQIREELTKMKAQEAKFRLEEDIVGQLIKSTNFEAPAIMVDAEAERLMKDARGRLLYMGYKKEDIEGHESSMKEKIKEEAVKRVKSFFILEKVAEAEGIKPSEEEIEKRIDLMASRSKRSPEDMKSYLAEKDLLDEVKMDIVQDKALEFLLSNAEIKES